ncbi:MAG: PKD domain-containing protein [Bacteroidetes bacterium]|nr:PKD domain-containing protein [Bacteroidota bacterium]MBS1628922.1 PKD domain-containing protein [Bacteroidota bacterium]
MDKRIIILMAVALLGSSAFFAYRKLIYTPDGIRYTIKPRAILKAGDSISFDDQTPGASRWKWDFGDGEFSISQSGNHIYMNPGRYEISLTTYGPFGMLKQQDTVNVIARDILAVATEPGIIGPTQATVGTPESWQSAATAKSYQWNVEGEPALAHTIQTGARANFNFKTPGTHTIVLHTLQPDATLRQDVTVVAAATTQPSIPLPPQHHSAAARPHPAHHQQQQKGNKLDDLGGPVEIKK